MFRQDDNIKRDLRVGLFWPFSIRVIAVLLIPVFCDISNLPNNLDYKGAISIGYKLLDSFIDQIDEKDGPTYQYFHHYRDVNTALDQLSLFACTYLDRLGIKYHLVGDSNKVASIKEAITDAWNLTKDL